MATASAPAKLLAPGGLSSRAWGGWSEVCHQCWGAGSGTVPGRCRESCGCVFLGWEFHRQRVEARALVLARELSTFSPRKVRRAGSP